jgi:hypothetical protein
MPSAEPNSYGELGPQEWRDMYAAYVFHYNTSQRTISDLVMLEIRLRRLGYAGKLLENELAHIRACIPPRR